MNQAEKSERAREAICVAARQLFAEKGYDTNKTSRVYKLRCPPRLNAALVNLRNSLDKSAAGRVKRYRRHRLMFPPSSGGRPPAFFIFGKSCIAFLAFTAAPLCTSMHAYLPNSQPCAFGGYASSF